MGKDERQIKKFLQFTSLFSPLLFFFFFRRPFRYLDRLASWWMGRKEWEAITHFHNVTGPLCTVKYFINDKISSFPLKAFFLHMKEMLKKK